MAVDDGVVMGGGGGRGGGDVMVGASLGVFESESSRLLWRQGARGRARRGLNFSRQKIHRLRHEEYFSLSFSIPT